jgi:hypothetical protein
MSQALACLVPIRSHLNHMCMLHATTKMTRPSSGDLVLAQELAISKEVESSAIIISRASQQAFQRLIDHVYLGIRGQPQVCSGSASPGASYR